MNVALPEDIQPRVVVPIASLKTGQDRNAAAISGVSGLARRMELVTSSINPPSLAAHTGSGTLTGIIAGLQVGDLVIPMDAPAAGGGDAALIFTLYTPVCTTAGEISCEFFNADDVTHDVSIQTRYFLVLHTS